MKTIPPACPEPETVKYWRSLDQLADTDSEYAELFAEAGTLESLRSALTT